MESSIPIFPQFTSLESHHQAEIDQSVKDHPPYSDYNFISLWSWDHARTTRLSSLNNNLVIRFQDYNDPNDFFYSFFGANLPDETATILLHHSLRESQTQLKLIPEVVINALKRPGDFIISEDRDSFDYIIAVDNIVNHHGRKNRRKEFRDFMSAYEGRIKVSELDVASHESTEKIMALFTDWQQTIGTSGQFNPGEREAIRKLLSTSQDLKADNLHVVGLHIDGELSAFAITEILEDGIAMGHFMKSNKKHHHIGMTMDKLLAESLRAKGVTHINYEQDMGIEGLRESKLAKQPVHFLKKYNISLK